MKIAELADRFEFYAQVNTDIAHTTNSKTPSFLVCDVEEIAAALKSGIKLPCMFLQVPEFEKSGLIDNAIENVECSFIILKHVKPGDGKGKLAVLDDCKEIADQVINYMIEDSDEYFEGGQVKTSEGKFGPIGDNLFGWGVNFGFDQGYNGEVNEAKRRALP